MPFENTVLFDFVVFIIAINELQVYCFSFRIIAAFCFVDDFTAIFIEINGFLRKKSEFILTKVYIYFFLTHITNLSII